MKRSQFLFVLASSLAIAGCSDDNPTSQLRYPTVAVFAPSDGDIPVPNDLLFSGSGDVTLNIPVADPADTSDPLVALNGLDGWSTSAPFVVRFSRDIDMATVVAGASVRMFEVSTLTLPALPVGGPVTGIVGELVAGTDYSIEAATEYPGTTAIRIVPEAALLASTLAAKHTYMVVVTNAVKDAAGFAVSKDTEYLIGTDDTPFDPNNPATAQLAALQQVLLAMEFAADAAGIDRSTIVLTMSFTTQSTEPALEAARRLAQGDEVNLITEVCALLPFGCADTTPSGLTPVAGANPMPSATTAAILPGSPGFADLHVGQLRLPYYQTAAPNTTFSGVVSDPAPLLNQWRARYPFTPADTDNNLTRFNPLPVATGEEIVPLLIARPNATSGQTVPVGGWPVVIFQHGITRDRGDMLFVADRLAAAGFVVISMDLPLHGISTTSTFSPLFLGYIGGQLRERTFGLDLVNNTTGAPVPDGVADPSGQHFLNLANLANSRDNLRQAISDLFNLRATIGTFTVGGDALDTTNIHFVGHSLGGIVGTAFAALDSEVESAVFSAIGGGIPYLLDESVGFGPTLQAGLGAAGVLPGTPDYSSFLFAAQTVVDSGDPINYTAALTNTGIPVLYHEVIGGGPGGGLPDQTIPNSVPGRPLGGTEPLISALGLAPITATANGSGVVRFIEGFHGSILTQQDPFNPDPFEAAATAEMHAEIASFLASFVATGTATTTVTDTTVIDTNP
ncbi:MAG: alpha/beta fold hydrolase [Planctomycetota bacterium]